MSESNGPLNPVRWRDSLIVRVMVLCAVLVLCLLGAVYFLTGHYYQQVVTSMEHQADAIARSVKIQLDAHPPEFGEALDELPENFDTSDEGVPIDLELVAEVTGPDTVTPQVSEEGYFFMATKTFQLDDGRWVELTMQLDVNPQTELIRAFKNRFLFALSATFILTLCLMVYLIAKTLRPLRALSNSCAEISEGNLQDVRAGATSGEIRALEETFNRMVTSLREKEVVEANLRQAQRLSAIGNLAAGVAHDVRNPLNAIKLLSSQALDDIGESDKATRPGNALRTIRNEVDRLEDIVSGFLSLAREEELQPEPSLIDPLLEECLSLVTSEAETHFVRITSELRAGETSLLIDGRQLTRAILNILLNALQACPEGGRVRMFSRVTDQDCEIEIRDDGPGIPRETLEHVFDAYFTTKAAGTGLGLSIARGIVEEHGGKIVITSTLGQGCQVLISLPLTPKTQESAEA